jgi:hypothetical protein
METTINAMCGNIKNYFAVAKYEERFVIENGNITLPFLRKGQYFRICESVLNDGVHKYTNDMQLVDEEFNGIIYALAIPQEFLLLAEEIEAYNKTEASKPSGYASESFDDYSYSKAGGGSVNTSANANQWEQVIKSRLNRFRKV